MNVKRLLSFGLVAVLAIFLMGMTPTLSLASEISSSSGEASSVPGDLEITRDPVTGAVRFLRSRRGLDSGVDRAALTLSPSGAVFTFLARYQDLLGMPNAPQELVFQERKVDRIGMIHIKLQQVHQGVPVYGAEVRVHYAPDGKTVRVVNGRFIPHLAIRPQPTLDRDAALAIVRTIQPDGNLWEEPLLRIYSGHIDPAVSGDHLAWLVRIFDEDEPSRNLYVVDAHTGEVLTTYNELNTGRDREIYDADNDTRLPGTLVRSEGDEDPIGDEDADNAYAFLGETYDYFFDEFGRDSYDDNGATLVATVHYGTNYENAFWNGLQMVFGDGFTVDDVTAHELTHAVTEHSANLIYRNQSGALNESFSDIFGEIVDQENDENDNDPADDWLIGEDLSPIIGRPIRNMANPPEFGDPDMFSKYVCTPSDNGGVHTNSGIPNKAAYLMAEGGNFNGKTITGIGRLKMGQVQYRALTVYLTPSSSFVDDYNALNQSCQDLFGTDDICEQVDNALLAVEMNMNLTCRGWGAAYDTLFATPSDLDLFRRYRDQFLAKTRRGRLYTKLLYKHSEDALGVLLANPDLMFEAVYLISANRDAVSEVLNGYEGVIYDTDEIVSFLNAYAKKSPMALKILAYVVKWKMLIKRRRGETFLGFELR